MKTIVTHIAPDTDALSSIWLIRRFLPGWRGARVVFVPAGETLEGKSPDEHLEIIHVDTGFGKFDHHQTNDDTCAAKNVYAFLKEKKHIKPSLMHPLERMLIVINDTDHFRDVFLPHPDADIYTFLLDSLLDGLRAELADDHILSEKTDILCDAILRSFVNKVHAEHEIEKGLVFETKWGKTIALLSENEESARLAQKKGFALTIRKTSKKGHLRIKLSPDSPGVYKDLSKLYEILKKKDLRATWFYHVSGCMILNGSSKNPRVTPTMLSLHEVVQIVQAL
ncbi:MAG TPA: hypothetical protein VJH96_00720 [Patescibacteria group bacterium]|nr:hypothetical protein [Patescibacteria group bacterium]